MKILNKTLAILGIVGLGAMVATPSHAIPQAFASGSSAITLMNGAAQTIGGEVAAPAGVSLGGSSTAAILFTGSTGAGLSTNAVTVTSLDVTPGAAPDATVAPVTFTASAAKALDTTAKSGLGADLSNTVSIIKAGTGSNGLE